MKHVRNNIVPLSILLLGILAFYFAGVSPAFLASEVYTRFVRNTLFTLALILPITCGMGINFAIVVGAISAQIAIVLSIDLMIEGIPALLFVTLVSVVLSVIFGSMVASLLNHARGKEMIVSIMIGQLSSVMYQFVFMVAYGMFFQPKNKEILLDRGIGVRSMLDAKNIGEVFDRLLPFQFDGKTYSAFPLVIIACFAALLYFLQKTKFGTLARAVGTNMDTARKLGIDADRIRSLCIIISTVFASMSQILYVADFGTINVYTGHQGMDTFAAAAILVGGATIKKVKMRNCFVGVILFHALFVTSPLAGQNLFQNPSVGEYFRSFLAYGVIVAALIVNLRQDHRQTAEKAM